MSATVTAGRAASTRSAEHSKRLINVGIIGFGKMGRIRYDTFVKHGGGRVIAIADPQVQPPSGVKTYQQTKQLLADPGIDAVFICTPNHLNQPLTICALQAGKHVFCEKPPAFDARGMEAVIEAERQAAGKKLMYGFNHRHHESIRKAKELIDSGVYGRILWMRGRYGKSVDQRFYQTWRAKRELAGGGILLDQGIHMLDLFLMFGGEFEDVHAFVSNLYWKLDVEDNVFAILRNRHGLVASLHSTMTQWRHLFSFEVFLEKGYIVINGLLTPSGTYGEEEMSIARNRTTAPAATWSDEEHFRFNVNNSWRYEIEQFVQAIREDRPITVGTSREAWQLMQLVDKVYAHA